MSKLGVMDIFSLEIKHRNEPLVKIDSMVKCSIRRDFDEGINVLTLEDVVVDAQFIEDIMSGKLDNERLVIDGKTKMRHRDGTESDVSMIIDSCRLHDFNLGIKYLDNKVSLVFLFDVVGETGLSNFEISVYEDK